MLTFLQIKTDLYRLVGVTSATVRTDIREAVRLAILQAQQRFVLHGDWGFMHQFRDEVYIPISVPYSTGTVTVTQDSYTVTGSGTAWTSDMVGRQFHVNEQEWYEIAAVGSATSINLKIPYQSTSASGSNYQIYQRRFDLPLNFSRVLGRQAKVTVPGFGTEYVMTQQDEVPNRWYSDVGRPQWFAIPGQTKGFDYYNSSTVTIATTSGTSTVTIATGTLPTDIVRREFRVAGEDRSYRIATRATAATFTLETPYVNPADQTGTLGVASSYAITPKDTQQIYFYPLSKDNRYIVTMPYIKRLPELLLDADISPISYAGYDEAFLAMCRFMISIDGRTSMRADLVAALRNEKEEAMNIAWQSEQAGNTAKASVEVPTYHRRVGPSWIQQ